MNLDNNESLKRLLLNMKYDSKKTLSENLNTLTLNNRQSFLILEGDQFTGTIVKSPGYQKTYEKLKLNKPFTLKNFSYQDSGNAQVVKIKGDHVETGMPVILKRTCGDANFELSFPENVTTTNDMRLAIGSQISLPQLKTKTDNEKCNVRTNFDSSTHWVKDQETWEALKNGLQWMLNKGWLCPGGTPCGQKIATDSSDNWIVIDQVYFHKRKEYGAFAGAKCGVKAKLASGGQLSGAVKDEKDSWHIDLFNTFLIDENDGNVKLDIPKYVTKYVRCTEGNKKDEKVVDKTKSDVKTTTQTKTKKVNTSTGWNENCQGTYSMSCKTPEVGHVQQCLKDQGLYPYKVDDKFGKLTRTAVYNKLGKSSFTDADIETICKTTSGGGGEPQDDFDLDMGRRTGEEQEIDDKTWTGDVY